MNWIKAGTTNHPDGSKEIRYVSNETKIYVESRTCPVPHANGIGSWMHTSYFVITPDGKEKKFWKLQLAKDAAEKLAGRCSDGM